MGASDSRTSGINHCVATLGGQIQSMRDAGADARAIRGHQMTLKFMKRELDAEDTLREQSKRVRARGMRCHASLVPCIHQRFGALPTGHAARGTRHAARGVRCVPGGGGGGGGSSVCVG